MIFCVRSITLKLALVCGTAALMMQNPSASVWAADLQLRINRPEHDEQAPRFYYPSIVSNIWKQSNVCEVMLCHGTCANGANSGRLKFLQPIGIIEACCDAAFNKATKDDTADCSLIDRDELQSPCPWRTFKNFLRRRTSKGDGGAHGCCK